MKFRHPRLTDVPIHKHIYPGQNHSYAFRQMLLKVRQMVKAYGSDKIMVINGDLEFADCADATMVESYISSWAWKGRKQNWRQLKELARKYASYIERGGAVIALSYFGERSRRFGRTPSFPMPPHGSRTSSGVTTRR